MGLRGSDIPSTSQPSKCSHLCNGSDKCGKEAHNVVSGQVKVFDQFINVKKMVCDECLNVIAPNETEWSLRNA